MSNELSPFSAAPDHELGTALRAALEAPHHGAFLTRVRARLAQQERRWEDELSRWFWQGLVAASLATVLAGWTWTSGQNATGADVEASVASELLDGRQPGTEILLVAMTKADH